MCLIEDLVFLLFFSPTTLLGAVALLLVLYLVSRSFTSQEMGKEPPGPRPLPLLGNLLQLDLKRHHKTLFEFSLEPIKWWSWLDTRQSNRLWSATQKSLETDIAPLLLMMSIKHMVPRILFANGESWKEMRRFALRTLKEFGMGKRVAEEKIIEECHHLIKVFEEHDGKPFDTTSEVHYAASNILSSIMYGKRFEYSDPRFINMVRRANKMIRLSGSASIQLCNAFPWLGRWIKNQRLILKDAENNVRDVRDLIKHLKATLDPQICRGLVDCFLIHQQKEEE